MSPLIMGRSNEDLSPQKSFFDFNLVPTHAYSVYVSSLIGIVFLFY